MRIYLESLGCRLNYAEMAALGRRLAAAGHELATSLCDADVGVLNSCAVTAEAERQSRQVARQMARANPSARLIVTGCYATLGGEGLARLPNVSLVVGNDRKDQIATLLEEAPANRTTPSCSSHHRTPGRTRAFVKVQDGCRNRCTYCIVTVARGAERSRPIAEIVTDVNALQVDGFQEAVLTGVHLGGYGSDLGTNLCILIEELLKGTSMPRLRLSSLEPFDIEPSFFDFWPASAGRLMPHLHLPAQSGSDSILRRMARRNRVRDYEALVDAARARIPGLTVTTDLIVGFPGETDADFARSVAFAQRIGFAHMHIFPFSPREGTPAARFGDRVPDAERKRRVHELAALDATLGATVRLAAVGQVRPVLWEHCERNGRTAWSGLTDNFLRVTAELPACLDARGVPQAQAVTAPSPDEFDLVNRITLTRLTGIARGELRGEIVCDARGGADW